MNFDDAQERSATAGEYVLGTLGAQDRATVERALVSDTLLQAEVYAWQDRLVGLSARVPAAVPAAQLWSRIEAGLVGDAAATGPLPPNKASWPAAANDPFWQRLRRWQGVSAAAIAAVLVLSTLLVLRSPPPETGARYLVLLQAPDKSTGWVVEGATGGEVHLIPIGETPAVPAGKTLQFWTKPEGAAGPTSLGLVHAGQAVDVPLSRLPGLGARQLFELTLEPEGGSPIGRPTGPVLFIGRAVRV